MSLASRLTFYDVIFDAGKLLTSILPVTTDDQLCGSLIMPSSWKPYVKHSCVKARPRICGRALNVVSCGRCGKSANVGRARAYIYEAHRLATQTAHHFPEHRHATA